MEELIEETRQTFLLIMSELDQSEVPVPKESIKLELYAYGVYNFLRFHETPLEFVLFELSDGKEFNGTYKAYYKDGIFVDDVLDWSSN